MLNCYLLLLLLGTNHFAFECRLRLLRGCERLLLLSRFKLLFVNLGLKRGDLLILLLDDR